MLPLVAGQLLREAVVGLSDLAQSRSKSAPGAAAQANGANGQRASNPLRNPASFEDALLRLFEMHGRLVGGPVDALRDILQDAKDHDVAVRTAMHAGLEGLLEQLAPGNVSDQVEQGRARTLAPGQDPRPKYWEHYAEFFRVITQNRDEDLPRPFVEAFAQAYVQSREDLLAQRREREERDGD
jgi:predicted component of type VI protein secretion system